MVMGELTTDVDVAVIGAGPGGYTAAIRAAQLGLDVVLIERDRIGGTCTNVGCIPSKALIHAADVKHDFECASRMGISGNLEFDYGKTQEWKDGVVKSLVDGVTSLCKLNGVEIITGNAFFASSDTLHVQGQGLRAIKFKKAIIATGTRIRELQKLPFDHEKIIDSTDALSLREIPKRMIVLGGGYIAVEMANMYQKFGSEVTIVYRGDRLLRRMDQEIGLLLNKTMEKLGTRILFNSDIEKVDGNTAYVSTPEGSRKILFDKILVAAGRDSDFSDLQLEKTGVKVEKGKIIVDSQMRTTDSNIYAIGDIVKGPSLAHKAFREGKVAAEAIAGKKAAFDNEVPLVVFSHPGVASVGMTEDEARESGIDPIVGKMPFSASGKAKAMNSTDGFVKVIADRNGFIRGMHVIGPHATELIAEGTFAIEMAARLEDVALTIHAHPTLPEAFAEACEAAIGKVIHLYRKAK